MKLVADGNFPDYLGSIEPRDNEEGWSIPPPLDMARKNAAESDFLFVSFSFFSHATPDEKLNRLSVITPGPERKVFFFDNYGTESSPVFVKKQPLYGDSGALILGSVIEKLDHMVSTMPIDQIFGPDISHELHVEVDDRKRNEVAGALGVWVGDRSAIISSTQISELRNEPLFEDRYPHLAERSRQAVQSTMKGLDHFRPPNFPASGEAGKTTL